MSSGSGDVTVGEADCPVIAKSRSGDVTVNEPVIRCTQAPARGITVADTSGTVNLRTASGSDGGRGRSATRLA